VSFANTLPHVTAALNAITMCFLLAGFLFIRRDDRAAHRVSMIGAVVFSGLFLAVYLLYHFTSPIFQFAGQGAARPVYYTLLVTHVVLAAAVTPMVALTFLRALRGRFQPHRGLARWTLPIWLYVSFSGLAVYAMLYHVYRPVA